jgi:hypothetical protein
MNEARKLKREELIMKRRGLNFVTESQAETLEESALQAVEEEIDNVAPKIVGILALNHACDIKSLRREMVSHCIQHMSNNK